MNKQRSIKHLLLRGQTQSSPCPQTPLSIECKSLFKLEDISRRKPIPYKIRQSLHYNRSPPQSQLQDRSKQNIKPDEPTTLLEDLQNDKQLLTQELNRLHTDNQSKDKQIELLRKQIDDLKLNLQLLKSNDSTEYYTKQLKEQQALRDKLRQDTKDELEYLRQQVQQANQKLLEKQNSIVKPALISGQIKKLESIAIEMHRLVTCKLCNKDIQEAVTIIPCAHSYCKSCRKGYIGQCYICTESTPIEAVYQNNFMTSMTELYRNAIELIKLVNSYQ